MFLSYAEVVMVFSDDENDKTKKSINDKTFNEVSLRGFK